MYTLDGYRTCRYRISQTDVLVSCRNSPLADEHAL